MVRNNVRYIKAPILITHSGTSLIKLGGSNSSAITFLPATRFDSQCNLVPVSVDGGRGKGTGGPSTPGGLGGLFGKGKGTGGKGKGAGGKGLGGLGKGGTGSTGKGSTGKGNGAFQSSFLEHSTKKRSQDVALSRDIPQRPTRNSLLL